MQNEFLRRLPLQEKGFERVFGSLPKKYFDSIQIQRREHEKNTLFFPNNTPQLITFVEKSL